MPTIVADIELNCNLNTKYRIVMDNTAYLTFCAALLGISLVCSIHSYTSYFIRKPVIFISNGIMLYQNEWTES